MRLSIMIAIVCLMTALACGSLYATQTVINSTFDADLGGWVVTGWDNDDPPDGLGTGAWDATVGSSGGGVHFAGFGTTDGNANHQREGAYMDKTISTVGLDNIRIAYDLYTHLVGNDFGAGDAALVDHGELSEQLTVLYSTNNGANWTEAEWMKRSGGNGWSPLMAYNAGYSSRIVDLSSVAAANNNANFKVRFRWQFNTGCDLVGGCPSNGGDSANMDNIKVVGHNIGSPADTTAPGAVTGFSGSTADNFTTVLSWTNPADADYAGVTIRSSTTGYPATVADGNLVATVLTPGLSKCNDTSATAGVTYYYSAFSFDTSGNVGSAAHSTVVGSSVYWSDSFEAPYTLGQLELTSNNGSGGFNWGLVGTDQNVNQILIDNAYASPGTQAVKIWHHSASAADGWGNRSFTYNPANGIAKFHMRLNSPRGTGGDGSNFWYVYLMDSTGTGIFGQWYGAESQVIPRDGVNNFGTYTYPAPNTWYDLDMVVDTVYNKTYCFRNGALVFSGNHTANDTIGRIRIKEVKRTDIDDKYIYIDDVSIGQGVRPTPVINAPATGGGWVTSTTPTITWTSGTSETVLEYVLKVFTSDVANPETDIASYTGTALSGVPSHTVGTPLAQNTHLWAFVKERTANGWMPWSPQGQGGFYVGATAPPAPTVASPIGTVVGCKPMVTFTGVEHQSFSVRITNNAGATIWESLSNAHTGSGASCTAMLQPGVQYKAYAQVANSAGASAWSAASNFQVSRTNEGLDIRDMDEANLLTTNALPPNDGFGYAINYPELWPAVNMTAAVSDIGCTNSALQVTDGGHVFDTRLMRRHRLTGLDLNKGVTLAIAVAVIDQDDNPDNSGGRWLQSTSLLCDADGLGGPWLVGIRAYKNGVGLLTNNNVNWNRVTLPVSTDYRILRLTGRNRIYNDYTTAEWNLYLDENSTAVASGTGCMNGKELNPEHFNNWMNNCMTLGQGSGGLMGTWQFDWTAVNTDGNYAPGQWAGGTQAGYGTAYPGGEFASIGAAKHADGQAHGVTINNPMVISRIESHTEYNPDPFQVMDAYYAQDVATLATDPGLNAAISGVRIASGDDLGGTVAVGAKITSLSGVMCEKQTTGGTAILSPAVTIEGTAQCNALGVSQKTINGPCIEQSLGSTIDTNGMLVRVFGRVMLCNFDPFYGTLGGYVMYIDDGSGCTDGREDADGMPIPGIRCEADAADPNFVVPSINDYMMIEGIAGYETISVLETPAPPEPPHTVTKHVRHIYCPNYAIIANGI